MRSHYPTKLLLIDEGLDASSLRRIIEGGTDLVCRTTADTVQARKLAVMDPPHIIVMDTALPTGDGLPLLTWLRTNLHTKDIPIIVATQSATPAGQSWVGVHGGGVTRITKPCDKEALLNLIQQTLEHQVPAVGYSSMRRGDSE